MKVFQPKRLKRRNLKKFRLDCSFGNLDSFVKGTRSSVLILAKSHAGRKFEVLEAASLVSIYILIEWANFKFLKPPPGALNRQTKHIITYINTVFMFLSVFI